MYKKGGITLGTAERRTEIIRILSRRKHETIFNLAHEFGVSERTILRDIEVLSLNEPIYTQCGRYGGGVYISEDYVMNRMYMSQNELAVLQKILHLSKTNAKCILSTEESNTLQTIISQYTKKA